MATSPTSPRTPTRSSQGRPRPSHINVDIPAPSSPSSSHHRRRSSTTSSHSQRRPHHHRNSSSHSYAYSPTTPRTPGASRRFSNAGDADAGEGEGGLTLEEANGMDMGLGSLADELGGAWDDGDEEGEEDGIEADVLTEEPDHQRDHVRDSGIDIPSSSTSPPTKHRRSSAAQKPHSHRWRSSSVTQQFSEDDKTLISPSLHQRLITIENMARPPASSSSDSVLSRLLSSLRDLGPQSYVENGITRLSTSHLSLTTHLHHQTLLLSRLTLPLLSPLSQSTVDPEAAETLLSLIEPFPTLIPQPSISSLSSLQELSNLTTSLVATLSTLADTLHITAQTTALASRRLRSARELVDVIRREEEEVEMGRQWIENGKWEEKLSGRWCGRECQGVMDGFGEVCDGWREKLLGGEVAV